MQAQTAGVYCVRIIGMKPFCTAKANDYFMPGKQKLEHGQIYDLQMNRWHLWIRFNF